MYESSHMFATLAAGALASPHESVSVVATESDGVIYTKAGREIAVATTKAYSAQLSVFYALAIFVAALKGKAPCASSTRSSRAATK